MISIFIFISNAGATVHPRLHADIMYKGPRSSLRRCLGFLEQIMGPEHFPSLSTIYRYILPRRKGSHEARRHFLDVALNIRSVLPSRDGNNIFRVDGHFCNSQNGALRDLFYLFLQDGLILSRDDKARVFIFGSPIQRPSKTWVWSKAERKVVGESVQAHDFNQIRALSITITSTLQLRLDTPTNKKRISGPPCRNGGKAVFYLKSSTGNFIYLFIMN
jgi:hypothetical protein